MERFNAGYYTPAVPIMSSAVSDAPRGLRLFCAIPSSLENDSRSFERLYDLIERHITHTFFEDVTVGIDKQEMRNITDIVLPREFRLFHDVYFLRRDPARVFLI